MNTNELDWFRGMHFVDSAAPAVDTGGEAIYTLYMADFLKMPDVNYREVASVDLNLRSLFN